MKTARILVLAGALLAAPAFAQKPQIQWDQEYDFDSVSSFMWRANTGQSLEAHDPFLHNHIINTIEFQLTSSGLTEVQSDPDIIVTYFADTETEVRLQSNSYGYGWGSYGRGGWGYYGYGMGGPVSTTTRVVEYERGSLIIDIVDGANNELIWRGSVNGITVSSKPEKTQRNITKAIEKMVKQARKLRARVERQNR